jgi:hypothetical protein
MFPTNKLCESCMHFLFLACITVVLLCRGIIYIALHWFHISISFSLFSAKVVFGSSHVEGFGLFRVLG